ncbi:hypothetical protein A2368_04400 [Candidatus Collierbacteria bacterium RIFOXYB1_FULL_49_13]|uniref:Uncharacterized protein n=1 Tax=Candidatus Collierbacteria bacterium RIFOXYB1_FULL_49_13 TaxID=1817728 RepID=A0A1F5FG12_9BACT|nr:MAG: hypothetical protein A2368_04400 [Candidatus Collierbacteria bacterium RIFOXYB1_FULL_49_13]
MDYTRVMAKLWLGVAGSMWLLAFGFQMIVASRQAETVGEVHWMVDNQRIYNRKGFAGWTGRAVANKWVVGFETSVQKATETVDPNILFYIGHPNERGGVIEQRYLPWWLIPFWLVGALFAGKRESGLVLLASAWAMVAGTAGVAMYPMAAVYGWLIVRGIGYIWQKK